MNLITKLKTDIQKFLKETGMSKSMLGKEALNDHHAVFLFLKGKDWRISTAQRLYAYMEKYKRKHDRIA